MDDKRKNELNKKLEEANKIYQNLTASVGEKQKKKFEDLQKSFSEPLSSLEQQRKKELELLYQSMSSVQNSLQDSLSENLRESYVDSYLDIAKKLSKENEPLEASSDLTNLGKKLNNDIYHHKIDTLSALDVKPLPEVRNYAQEMLDELKTQNKRFSIVIENLERQNKSLEQQIEQDQLFSEKQINNNKASFEKQLKDSKRTLKWTIAIAVFSIISSIGSTFWSIYKSEDIYYKEDNSSNLQHKELKMILENNNNKNLILEDKQLNVLNQILQSLNEKKIIKDKNITK